MKDLLDSMTIEEYFGRIMNLPLYETDKKYNSEKPRNLPKAGLEISRKLSRYREFFNRKKRILRQIDEETDFLIKAENRTDAGENLKHRKNGLVDLYINLSEVSLRVRECEEIYRHIEDKITKAAVKYRYFEDTDRKIPGWNETAKAVGIPLNSAELRAYVNENLAKISKKPQR